MKVFIHKIVFVLFFILLFLIVLFSLFFEKESLLPNEEKDFFTKSKEDFINNSKINLNDNSEFLAKKLSNPPEIIKAIYLTGWSAGSISYMPYLKNLLKSTEINAVVIDIKDYSGLVSYSSEVEDVKKYKLKNWAISDINSLINFLHSQNVYVIGRISVFQDLAYSKIKPELAVYDKEQTKNISEPILWRDYKNLSWLDPASKEIWDYNIALAKEAFLLGFDEINFDYIRFPSDGNLKNMGFPFWDEKIPMRSVIRNFFQYVRTELYGEKISVDLFGLTTVESNDLGIGQKIEDSFEFFDYVCPMVYPSHYAPGFIGFQNPAEYPYQVIKYSLEKALEKKQNLQQSFEISYAQNNELFKVNQISSVNFAKIRPWLQDFDLGAEYTPKMVEYQIKAVKDSLKDEFNGFILWSPSNIYTLDAIKK
jgi:hypothetical protein